MHTQTSSWGECFVAVGTVKGKAFHMLSLNMILKGCLTSWNNFMADSTSSTSILKHFFIFSDFQIYFTVICHIIECPNNLFRWILSPFAWIPHHSCILFLNWGFYFIFIFLSCLASFRISVIFCLIFLFAQQSLQFKLFSNSQKPIQFVLKNMCFSMINIIKDIFEIFISYSIKAYFLKMFLKYSLHADKTSLWAETSW